MTLVRPAGDGVPVRALPCPACPAAVEEASTAAALGKRKAPESAGDEAEAAAAAAGPAEQEQPDSRANKRTVAGDDAEPRPPAKQQQQGTEPKRKRKAAEDEVAKPANEQEQAGSAARKSRLGEASPALLPRVAVRPRWEQLTAAAPSTSAGGAGTGGSTHVGAVIGSPVPSPYRSMSPAKPGAASLNQLPGYQFSRAARPRRSSAASDASTAASGGSAGGAAQPLYRRKLAAPPSRLGGEPMLPCRSWSVCGGHNLSLPVSARGQDMPQADASNCWLLSLLAA